MSRRSQKSLPLPSALVMTAAAAAVYAAAFAGWLSDRELSAVLWPGDINARIVKLCGGVVSRNALGQQTAEVYFLPLLFRLFVVLAVPALTLLLPGRRGSGEMRIGAARCYVQTAFVLIMSASWWLIYFAGEFFSSAMVRLAVGVLPQWLPVSLALALFVCWKFWFAAAESRGMGRFSDRCGLVLVVLCASVWALVSFWMNWRLYELALIPHGDSAMYEEHLWNIWHGKGFRSYLDQGLFLGEHFQVIHLLLLPLHILWPSHLLLELAESIALASCSVAVFVMARRYTGSSLAASLLGIAWLFYFPMHFLDIAIDQKTFRPVVLGLPFLFWMIEFAEQRRVWPTLICCVLALSAKEDVGLVVFPLLAVLAVRIHRSSISAHGPAEAEAELSADPSGNRRFASFLWGLSAFSVCYVVFVVLIGIPAFRGGEVVHYSRYFGDLGRSPAELMHTLVARPQRVLQRLFSVRTLLYLWVFLVPLACVPLRRAELLLAGVFSFPMLALIELGDSASGLPPIPYHHFHAPLLPVIFWAAAVGIGSFQKRLLLKEGLPVASRPAFLKVTPVSAIVLLCAVSTAFTGSLMPCGITFWSTDSDYGKSRLYLPTDPRMAERAQAADVVQKMIPLTARVAATDFIHARLTHCERSYDYSDYLRKVNNYQPGVPADTDYIVIDTTHRYSRIRKPRDIPELQQHPEQWELLPTELTHGHFLILRRRPPQD